MESVRENDGRFVEECRKSLQIGRCGEVMTVEREGVTKWNEGCYRIGVL